MVRFLIQLENLEKQNGANYILLTVPKLRVLENLFYTAHGSENLDDLH